MEDSDSVGPPAKRSRKGGNKPNEADQSTSTTEKVHEKPDLAECLAKIIEGQNILINRVSTLENFMNPPSCSASKEASAPREERSSAEEQGKQPADIDTADLDFDNVIEEEEPAAACEEDDAGNLDVEFDSFFCIGR